MINPNRDIFVISDLHLGDHGKRDNFFLTGKSSAGNEIKRSDVFESFLDMVKKRNGQLVILGDLFEFWQANIGEVIRVNLSLLDKLAEMKAVFVVGNHDIDLEPLIESKGNVFKHPFFSLMTTAFITEIGEKRFKFFHGHEIDPYNLGNSPAWGRMMAILAGIAEDHLGAGAGAGSEMTTEEVMLKLGVSIKNSFSTLWSGVEERWDEFWGNKHQNGLTPAQSKSLVSEHFQHMEKEREKGEFDIAVCGHTHVAGRFESWYVNSGSWVKFRNGEPVGNFLRIYPTGQIDVCVAYKSRYDYIETEFVRDQSTGIVMNFDFENGEPIK